MVLVTENYPGVLPSYNQKSDVQAVPVGSEDKWVDAGDMNLINGPLLALLRAIHLHATLTGRVPATSGITKKVVHLLGTISDTVPDILADFTTGSTTDLNKNWALGIESIERGGDVDGTASASACFVTPQGIVSNPGGFVTNRLYDLSSDGTFFTYAGGKFGPIARGLNSNYAMFDASRRVMADNSTIQFNASGALAGTGNGTSAFFSSSLRIPNGPTFGNVSTALTADGHIAAIDSPTHYLFRTNGVNYALNPEISRPITVEGPSASEDLPLFKTKRAITITQISALVDGTSPSVTWTIRHALDRSAAGTEVVTGGTTTTNETTGDDITSFDDATIPANSNVWLETTAKSGTVLALNLTLFWTHDVG